jgi:histone acetyltransferase (RNA polymerase elongator complex component)
MYPETTAEFWKICHEQYETFCKKQMNYGKGNIMLGGDADNDVDVRAALMGLAIRINDKANRLINLTVKNRPDVVGESIVDTFQDMSVYGIIAQIVINKKWK